jgi:hypothetical protein
MTDERGSALVVAIIVTSLILSLGFTSLALTDQQTRESGVERMRESSFNLAEGALQQQSFLLGGKGWPKVASPAPPSSCGQTSSSQFCPTPAALIGGAGAYEGTDYDSGASWVTFVRDNIAVGNQVYSSTIFAESPAQPTWDANGDGLIWVKSSATVGAKPAVGATPATAGRTRTIIALLKRDPIPIGLRKAVLVAGGLNIPQNGQSNVITTDSSTPVVLRCAGYGGTCNSSNTGKGGSQISPIPPQYTGADQPPYTPTDALEKIIDSATTFTPSSASTCPSAAQLTGIVVIAPTSNSITCKYTGNTAHNSMTAPGIVIMRRGVLELAGNGPFFGVILHLNEGNDGPLKHCIDITGTPDVTGGIIVEGNCGFQMNGNARLVYDPNMWNFSVTGVAGLVQNTWRELTA